MNDYQPIPVTAAKDIAIRFDRDIVILCAWSRKHNLLHVTTYGTTPEDKVSAAKGGELASVALGSDLSRATNYEDFRTHEHAAKMTAENEVLKAKLEKAKEALRSARNALTEFADITTENGTGWALQDVDKVLKELDAL